MAYTWRLCTHIPIISLPHILLYTLTPQLARCSGHDNIIIFDRW